MPNVILKKEWGALPAHGLQKLAMPTTCVFYCYSNSTPCEDTDDCKYRIREIQIRCIKKYKIPDIRYNFLIDTFGNVYIGRGWRNVPSLPFKYQALWGHMSLLFAFIGFYKDSKPPEVMIQARDDMIKYGVKKGFISEKYVLMFP